jgi:hypothetical protein
MPIQVTVLTGPHKGRAFTLDEQQPLYAHFARLHFHLGPLHLVVEGRPPRCRLVPAADGPAWSLSNAHGRQADPEDLRDGDILTAGDLSAQVALRTIHSPGSPA